MIVKSQQNRIALVTIPDGFYQRATDTDTMMMNSPERTEISLKRQYGYAIMALSVVVLAVLTVSEPSMPGARGVVRNQILGGPDR